MKSPWENYRFEVSEIYFIGPVSYINREKKKKPTLMVILFVLQQWKSYKVFDHSRKGIQKRIRSAILWRELLLPLSYKKPLMGAECVLCPQEPAWKKCLKIISWINKWEKGIGMKWKFAL